MWVGVEKVGGWQVELFTNFFKNIGIHSLNLSKIRIFLRFYSQFDFFFRAICWLQEHRFSQAASRYFSIENCNLQKHIRARHRENRFITKIDCWKCERNSLENFFWVSLRTKPKHDFRMFSTHIKIRRSVGYLIVMIKVCTSLCCFSNQQFFFTKKALRKGKTKTSRHHIKLNFDGGRLRG